jgi:hypothetical protein
MGGATPAPNATYPAPRSSVVAARRNASTGADASSGRSASTCAALAPCGQSIPSRFAVRRNPATASASGVGNVRSTPNPARSIMSAATVPVSSEISAFQSSTGSRVRTCTVQPPSPSGTTSCSGSSSSIAPRATAAARRNRPTSGNAAIAGCSSPVP